MKRITAISLPLLLLAAAAASAQQPAVFAADDSGRPLFGFDIRLGGVAFDKDCWDESVGAAIDVGLRISLRGEVGARYVSMDIDDWDDDDYEHHHHHRRYGEWDRYYHPDRYLDVDDTSLAVVSLQIEFDLDPAFLAVGGGYQFDLERPDVEYLDRPIGKVDLSGALFYVATGLVF